MLLRIGARTLARARRADDLGHTTLDQPLGVLGVGLELAADLVNPAVVQDPLQELDGGHRQEMQEEMT